MAVESLLVLLPTVQKEWIIPSTRYYAQDYDGVIHSFGDMPNRYKASPSVWEGKDKRKLTNLPRFVDWHHAVVIFDGENAKQVHGGAVVDGDIPIALAGDKGAAITSRYPERAFNGLPDDVDYARIYLSKSTDAQDRNIRFDLGFSDFAEIVSNKVCCITGATLDHTSPIHSATRFSLDRLDPTLGYVKGNVVVMSSSLNQCKSDLDKFLSSGLSDEHLLKVLYKAEYVLRKRLKKKKEAEEAVNKKKRDTEQAFANRYGILPKSK